MKKPILKNKIVASFLLFVFLTGCYHFDFVNQPYTADPNSFFTVEISVDITDNGSEQSYFGILLPVGWTTGDSIKYFNAATNDSAFMVYSDSLSQAMTDIDLPPANYYWWVGVDFISVTRNETYISTFKIYTDNLTGYFYLDYMLGDNYSSHGLNYRRSNDHLIIIGEVDGCFPEGITFSNQEQINNFQTDYPECTKIAGHVTISGTDIINLSGLDHLTSIGGDLIIIDNFHLTNLTGLESLISIGRDLTIIANFTLTDLTGLNNITSVGRDLKLRNNYNALANLTGLENLISIGRDLFINGNSSLTDLDGFDNLTSAGRDLLLFDNHALTNMTGLENLTSISRDLTIVNNDAMTELTGLENLTSLGRDFTINDNSALTSLTGLEGLTSTGGKLVVENNYVLTNLTGLEDLTSMGGDVQIL